MLRPEITPEPSPEDRDWSEARSAAARYRSQPHPSIRSIGDVAQASRLLRLTEVVPRHRSSSAQEAGVFVAERNPS